MNGRQHVHGLHHVTAIAGDARENLHFYTKVLGMRLVKRSVNQDAPGTYHLFYADAVGTPGTDITFFPWPEMQRAQDGAGQIVHVSLAVPEDALDYWRKRLGEHNADVIEEAEHFGKAAIEFRDPHGLSLALVAASTDRPFVAWDASPVPVEYQVRGLHAVRSIVNDLAPTRRLLEEVLGFHYVGKDESRHRFAAADGDVSGQYIDVQVDLDAGSGAWGTGGVHHVAWRVPDDESLISLRRTISGTGLAPSPQIDRFWFHSVYFKEPGGVLFELATDGPGFDRDEDLDALGETLILPPWLEPQRSAIEAALPDLD